MICKGCQSKFSRNNRRQIFCTPDCRRKYFNNLNPKTPVVIAKPCKICGAMFETIHKFKLYCSPKCSRKSNRLGVKARTETKIKETIDAPLVECPACHKIKLYQFHGMEVCRNDKCRYAEG